jgi:2-succinyl-5-enolpyruvyl-6-hydroxy-3-cyclohexene-1-carboxylate synthase
MTGDTPQVNADFAVTLVEALLVSGVRDFVVSPGSRSTALALACAELEAAGRIRVTVVIDERVAGFLALGLCKANRTPVALVCTSGSAGAHYLPAVVEAARTGLPLVVLTADRPPELRDCGAPQTIDQVRLFGAHVVAFADPGPPTPGVSPAVWGRVAVDAVYAATGRPGGPVHLNLAFREPLWADGVTGRAVPIAPRLRSPDGLGLSSEAATRLDTMLSKARRPLVVCGARRPCDVTTAALLELAAWWRAPVLAEPLAQLRFAAGAPREVLACGEALVRAEDFVAGHAPDLLVRIGGTPTTRAVQTFMNTAQVPQVGVSLDGHRHDPTDRLDLLLDLDGAEGLRALTRAAAPAVDPTWRDAWVAANARAGGALEAQSGVGFWAGSVVCALVRGLRDGEGLHVASSMPVRDLDAFAPSTSSRVHVTANRGANGIDGTIATATGLARASGRPTFCLLGDVAFQHDLGALVAARGQDVDLTVVVVDNGGGGIFGFLPIATQTQAFARYFLTPPEADVSALAQAAGACVSVCDDAATLDSALETARRSAGLRVIHARIDRTFDTLRHREAFAAARAAVEAA